MPCHERTRIQVITRVVAATIAVYPVLGGSAAAPRSTPKLTVADTVVLGDVAVDGGLGSRGIREALRAALDESPYLNLLPDVTLEKLRPEPAEPPTAQSRGRDCQLAHGKVYITGTVTAALREAGVAGRLTIVDCKSSAILATEPLRSGRDGVIDALGEGVRRLRRDVGEPAASVEHFHTNLSRATSASVEALEAWSAGLRTWREQGPVAAFPALEKAVRFDPEFAAATYDLGLAYRNSGQEERARELFTRAFTGRDRASTRKRLQIAAQYHAFVTVDEHLAQEAFEAWTTGYPRDYKAVSNFGSFYGDVCRYPEAIALFERARDMAPTDVVVHEDLMEMLLAVGEFQRAIAVYDDIRRRHLDDDSPHLYRYVIAALDGDPQTMESQVAWFRDKPDLQHEILAEQADAAALAGHLHRARELTDQAVAAARASGNAEQSAAWLLNAAWREALFGNEEEARAATLQALSAAPSSREGEATAAIILARTGDGARAERLLADIERRYARHSVMRSYWVPTIRAQLALKGGAAAAALKELAAAERLDLLYPQVFFYSLMPSVVLRAEAYLVSGQPQRAAEQWQIVLRHPGIVQLSATETFAKLGLARTYAHGVVHRASSGTSARAAYQSFLASWQRADPDIPLLIQAQAEEARLH